MKNFFNKSASTILKICNSSIKRILISLQNSLMNNSNFLFLFSFDIYSIMNIIHQGD